MRLLVCALAVALLGAVVADRIFFDDASVGAPTRAGVDEVPGVFSGDFESRDLSQWSGGVQCANTGVPSSSSFARGTITVQSQIVGQGKDAARFDLPAAGTSNSCETLVQRGIGLGTDDYYGLMVRFPSDWREPSSVGWGLSIAQFNFEGIWGTPVQLVGHGDHVSLVIQSGLCNPVSTTAPGCAYSSGGGGNIPPLTAVPAPLALDVWHELIVHVHWASDPSGTVEVWHRLQGESDWTRTVSLQGYPTLQWTADGLASRIDSMTSDKIGAYRGPADFPITVWEDGFIRADSFAKVAAALP